MEYVKITKFVWTTVTSCFGTIYPTNCTYSFNNQDGFAMDCYPDRIGFHLNNLPGFVREAVEGYFVMDDLAFNTYFSRINSDPNIVVDFTSEVRNESETV